MAKKTWLSWSSGKDSAWALYVLRQDPEIELAGLFCTVNQAFGRVAMHAVRVALLRQQADSAGLPLHIVEIPYPCDNADYETIMAKFVARAGRAGVKCFAFGDLFLEDIRRYREQRLEGSGITPIFPLWGLPTRQLSAAMLAGGLKAVLTCVDPARLGGEFAGREYDAALLQSLPEVVDPCGENGEFHSFAYAGPMFKSALAIAVGEIAHRDGFVFADVLSANP